MDSTAGKGLTAWVSLSNGRVGLTKDGVGSTTWSNGSEKDVTKLTY
jgi:hypothetical protein